MMDLDDALEIVNDPSLTAYCDYTHAKVFRVLGEYEVGCDEEYDKIAEAQAYVAVELVLNDDMVREVKHVTSPDTAEDEWYGHS
jgi:hypothetical protein